MSHIVSFYSFKGGAGRSLLLANVARTLMQRGLIVLCADFDLVSGGLHNFFGVPCNKLESTLLDLFNWLSPEDVGRVLVDATAPAEVGVQSGRIWLLPTVAEPSKLSSVFEVSDNIPVRFRQILSEADELLHPDFILIDCPAGFSELTEGPIINADYLVCILKPTQQDAQGIRTLLDILATLGKSPSILLVLNQVQPGTECDAIRAMETELGPRAFSAIVPFIPQAAGMHGKLVEVVSTRHLARHMNAIVAKLTEHLE